MEPAPGAIPPMHVKIGSAKGQAILTDHVTIDFEDCDGEHYTLVLHTRHSEILEGTTLDIDLIYPNGEMGLESITIARDPAPSIEG